jgi:glycosyltransferase involved in cell wall biosynthesis
MQKTDFPYEIILGEDGSTDGTREICQEYANKYPEKVRLFLRSRENVIYVDGHPTGRYNLIQNIKAAKGKYLANCAGDDYWTDIHKLKKQVDVLESNFHLGGCFHKTDLIFNDGTYGKIYGEHAPSILYPEQTISEIALLHTSSIMFKRWSFNYNIKYNNILNFDIALFSLIVKNVGPLAKIDETMSVYRKSNNGLSEKLSFKNKYCHMHRIILMHYLNEMHNYKFDTKVKKIIKSEKNKLKTLYSLQNKQ